MRIFNRWGGLIFESNDIDYSWDGTINGTPAKAGIYIYEFQIKDLNGNPYEYTGHFTLLR
jgi:gliding motility-associated-like protein